MEALSIPYLATAVDTPVHDRCVTPTFRWEMRRPPSVDRQHWRRVMLHACCHAWIGGLQSFSISDDAAGLCVRGSQGGQDGQGRPAELVQALGWIDAALGASGSG